MADIVFAQTGYAGRVTLNRPEALNAIRRWVYDQTR